MITLNITNLKTRFFVPVELNALVCWKTNVLSKLYLDLNMSDKALNLKYENIVDKLKKSVYIYWLDYDMINEKQLNYFYPTIT